MLYHCKVHTNLILGNQASAWSLRLLIIKTLPKTPLLKALVVVFWLFIIWTVPTSAFFRNRHSSSSSGSSIGRGKCSSGFSIIGQRQEAIALASSNAPSAIMALRARTASLLGGINTAMRLPHAAATTASSNIGTTSLVRSALLLQQQRLSTVPPCSLHRRIVDDVFAIRPGGLTKHPYRSMARMAASSTSTSTKTSTSGSTKAAVDSDASSNVGSRTIDHSASKTTTSAAPLPAVKLRAFNRIKALATALKLPNNKVLKDIVVNRRKKIYCNFGDVWFAFDSVNSIIVPFDTAKALARHYGKEAVLMNPLDEYYENSMTQAGGYSTSSNSISSNSNGKKGKDSKKKDKAKQSNKPTTTTTSTTTATTIDVPTHRIPVGVLLGHFNHGKTSILDALGEMRGAATAPPGVTPRSEHVFGTPGAVRYEAHGITQVYISALYIKMLYL